MPIKAAILLCGPSFLIAPCLKIGVAKVRQIIVPGRFERRPRGLETGGAAISLASRLAARIEAAMPLPRLRGIRDARSLNNHADADASIVDVPGFRPIIDALASEFGHAPLKRSRGLQAIVEGVKPPPLERRSDEPHSGAGIEARQAAREGLANRQIRRLTI
jgi:hypothetical protein